MISERFEPFVPALARLGLAVEEGRVRFAAAVEELMGHPAVTDRGWSEAEAYGHVADAVATWRETLFEIEVEDDIGEQLLGRVKPTLARLAELLDWADALLTELAERDAARWARGEIDLDEPTDS